MTRLLYNLSIHNLLKIYHSENESLRKDQFEGENGKPLKELDDLLETLVKLGLIETETDPNLYYLCTESYDLIESDELEEHLLSAFNIEFEESEEKKARFSYQQIEPEKKKTKIPLLSQTPSLIPIVFLTIISLIYYFLQFEKDKPVPKNISPEAIDVLKEVIIIEAGDTLNLEEKEKLLIE